MTVKILIANRGEIAVRIARSISEMGFKPLGIYTPVDKNSLHRKFVYEDVEVSSYLSIDEIIEAAIELGADAIHPGYGFLSENSVFARKVIDKGIVWIGPRPEAIERAGDKIGLKETAIKLGLPTLPYQLVKDPSDIIEFARVHGYPVLIKAAGGGGGIGMRIVFNRGEAEEKARLAQEEAERAFGDKRIYVEPYLGHAKHIEVQILGDGERVIHMYERECSIQFRYQKLVEEAPSPSITGSERDEVTRIAVELMKAIGYDNAGTVEFLFDTKNRRFYVMEVNTRLQVEHPVTELVTGVDIVKKQIKIAFEGVLDIGQEDIVLRGHAIEARVMAVNPISLTPVSGYITRYREPSGPGIRVDSGVAEGSYIPADYNPLISKIVAFGSTREEAVSRLLRALNEYVIDGIQTNIYFLKSIIQSPEFIKATYTTEFVSNNMDVLAKKVEQELSIQALATAVASVFQPDFNKLLKGKIIREKPTETRVEAIKRRAWTYWTLTRSRLRRK
ncbi:acetyl-CoA carboxylase biotin carboxylase subunit [Thermogladius sp. 4427co]|uniref:acetyl-CoA carboxylase biotin carboxylase subunit n=1 Tax=Thermogladius sp. 4427co TaxID=3450718 RepID=UPI003F79F86F